MEMDWSVGEILKSLKKKGIFDNTLIIFTSDNGPFLERGERGGFQGGVRSEGGVGKWERLKGGKGQTWEGGVRVPGFFFFFFFFFFVLFRFVLFFCFLIFNSL